MQEQKIKLKEIIWEITAKCDNCCSYCGSKENWNKEINYEIIDKIVERIHEYPPEEINLSGGDPLLIDIDKLKEIVDKFNQKNIKTKIIINPKSLPNRELNFYQKLSFFYCIGLSINNKEELDISKNINNYQIGKNKFEKTTIITNFNIDNIFLFDDIAKFIKKNKLMWQIQYTMYKNKNDIKAIYNNNSAFEYLKNKINEFAKNNTNNIILADNMTADICTAGINSVGITYDGKVIPCLSMRSWSNKIETYDLLKFSLKQIWESGFKKQRFGQFECCKDNCKNKIIRECNNFNINIEKKIEEYIPIKIESPSYPFIPQQPPLVTFYGVFPKVTAYAVFPNNNKIYIYGVKFNTSYTNNWNNEDENKI
jgi:MoaA/NifB/PqqE/SkfB family radical SAM enzyme